MGGQLDKRMLHWQPAAYCIFSCSLLSVIWRIKYYYYYFTKKWNLFDILGPHFHPPVAIEVKFCTAKRTNVPVRPAKFDVNRYNESTLRGEKPDRRL